MLKKTLTTACFIGLATFGHSALAVDAAAVPAPKRTDLGLYLTAGETYEKMTNAKQQALFLDIRSRAEVQFLGMPSMADANVPYMEFGEMSEFDEKGKAFRLEQNAHFVEAVAERLAAKGLTKSHPVIVMCRSGDRSARAANLLAKAGFTQVYTVIDGYEGDKASDGPNKGKRLVNGWKNSGLPWTYDLDKAKMYRASH